MILYSAWGLLSDSVELALDAVPKDIDQEKVKQYLEELEGVEDVHDLHIWAMSTTETALTAHRVMLEDHNEDFLYKTREKQHHKFEITHTTLQVEKDYRDDEYSLYQN